MAVSVLRSSTTGGHPVVDGSLVYQRLWNPNVDRFERDMAAYTGAPRAVAVVNGTAALHVALVLAGVVSFYAHADPDPDAHAHAHSCAW